MEGSDTSVADTSTGRFLTAGTLARQSGTDRCRRLTVVDLRRCDAGRTHRGRFQHLHRGVDKAWSSQISARTALGGNRLTAPGPHPPRFRSGGFLDRVPPGAGLRLVPTLNKTSGWVGPAVRGSHEPAKGH